MKLPESWLREWVNPSALLEDIISSLTMAGLEVETVENTPNGKVMDVHITPNRSDCLSVRGLAREVAVLTESSLQSTDWANQKLQATAPENSLNVHVLAPEACPRYCGRVIQNINSNAKTPDWMAARLNNCGIDLIHPVVDVANYVMLELGQPLHAFDLKKINDEIIVRFAKPKEKLLLLNDKEVELDDQTLIIADKKGSIAIAGIMGGKLSGVTSETTALFLESAFFDPRTIAGRARRYGLNTDASHRFERGVDPFLAREAIERASQLILEICGGELGALTEVQEEKHLPTTPTILLRESRIARVLGHAISAKTIEDILRRLIMDFRVCGDDIDKIWEVTPPSYRFDLILEEDLIEEIARIVGYHQLPPKHPKQILSVVAQSESEISLKEISETLTGLGYHEAITYSFVSENDRALIDPHSKSISLQNPISNDLAVMRTSLWPGLLRACAYNQARQQKYVRMFEMGLRFTVEKDELVQEKMLAGIATDLAFPEQWGHVKRSLDFYDVKGDLEKLWGDSLIFEKATHPALHPGKTAVLIQDNKKIGWVGALHPELYEKFDLSNPIFLFECLLKPLQVRAIPHFSMLSKFPSSRRDISFVIDKKIDFEKILNCAKNIGGQLLQDVCLFDVFAGKEMSANLRSLALGLILQHPERTLTDDEISNLVNKIIDNLIKEFAIQLRTQ